MKEHGKSKVTKLGVALLAAGSLYLAGTSDALAKEVIVRPGDRVVYRYPATRDYYHWRDRNDYGRYDWRSRARFGAPPPWAASWYRSRHWRNEWNDNWRDGWRGDWRRHRGERD